METDLAAHLGLAALAILLVSATAASVPLADPQPDPSDPADGGSGDRSPEGTDVTFPDVPSVSLVALTVLAVGLGAAGYWLRRRTGPSELPAETRTDTDPPDLASPPERGGDDHPRQVKTVPPANEVYRAWNELARRVVRPDTTSLSPTEVARRARARSLNADAVEDLTALFLAVRYGPVTATADVERRAREAADRLDSVSSGKPPDDQSEADAS